MHRIATLLWPVVAALTFAGLIATLSIRPELLANYRAWPAGWLIPAVVAASLAAVLGFARQGRDRAAFLWSCAYVAAMLAGAAFALYPTLLPATTGADNALTIYNSAAGADSLSKGLVWWTVGMGVAVAYFVVVYRMFAGKVRGDGHY